MIRKYINNEKGFTLVELMVVVVIIGILVAIAVPLYAKAQEASETATCKANLRTIDGAVVQYNAANPTTPITGAKTAVELGTALADYLKAMPTCPSTASNNSYTLDAGKAVCPNKHTYP